MRNATAAALAALCCALAACGSTGGPAAAPQGSPDARVGPQVVDGYASVELLRGLLIASGDSYASGASSSDARVQLRRARSSYGVIAGRVKAADAVVDREVNARFDLLFQNLKAGIGGVDYRNLEGPLWDQLMDGVTQALVPPRWQLDRGLQAEVLSRLAARLGATYDTSASGTDPETARLAFEESWGDWRRAQVLSGVLNASLGPEANAVSNAINNIRAKAFPNGPIPPDAPPATYVDAAVTRIQAALEKRYSLQGP